MKKIKVLLYKEYIIFKKSFIFYFLFAMLLPFCLYLFFSIPLSIIFINMKPIYLVWSSVGIWFVSAFFLSYLFNIKFVYNNYNNSSMRVLPILSYHYLCASYIYTVIVGIIEMIIAIIITSSFTLDYLSFINYSKIIFISIPAFLIISNISFLINKLYRKNIFYDMFNLLIFLLICLGFGSFIPLSYFPDSYVSFIKYMPIASTIYNSQNIISNEPMYFSLIFVSIFYAIILTLINYYIIENNISNKN